MKLIKAYAHQYGLIFAQVGHEWFMWGKMDADCKVRFVKDRKELYAEAQTRELIARAQHTARIALRLPTLGLTARQMEERQKP
jgi:hypothetical protein